MRIFYKDGELKSKNLNSYGKLVHNMCIHSLLPRAGTFDKVTNQDMMIMYHLWTRKKLSLPSLMVNHMMAVAEPIKSTSCLPYGMAMTRIFKYFRHPLIEKDSMKNGPSLV